MSYLLYMLVSKLRECQLVSKRYQRSRNRKRGAGSKRIEKDAVAILDRRDIFVRDAGHYLVQSMSVDDVYCSIRHAGGLWTVHAQVASKFMPETACRS